MNRMMEDSGEITFDDRNSKYDGSENDRRTSLEINPVHDVYIASFAEEESRRADFASKESIEMMPGDTLITIDADTTDERQPHIVVNQRNTYAAKKTIAQGMMDVALITANANQLRYLIEYQYKSPTFYLNVVLIMCSLILQVAVGISLIFKGRFEMKGQSKSHSAKRINNYVIVGVFLTTIINIFVASFSISSSEAISIVSTTAL